MSLAVTVSISCFFEFRFQVLRRFKIQSEICAICSVLSRDMLGSGYADFARSCRAGETQINQNAIGCDFRIPNSANEMM